MTAEELATWALELRSIPGDTMPSQVWGWRVERLLHEVERLREHEGTGVIDLMDQTSHDYARTALEEIRNGADPQEAIADACYRYANRRGDRDLLKQARALLDECREPLVMISEELIPGSDDDDPCYYIDTSQDAIDDAGYLWERVTAFLAEFGEEE